MKILNKLLDKIGVDKVLHFLVGAWAVSTASPFGIISMGIAAISIILSNIAKELWLDSYADYKDVIAAAIGCISSTVIWAVINIVKYYAQT